MMRTHPKKIIVIGFFLVLSGFVVPFLMVLQIVKASFLLSFLSYGASIAGLFLGIIGAASYIRLDKRNRQ
jgi:hypothetical protein